MKKSQGIEMRMVQFRDYQRAVSLQLKSDNPKGFARNGDSVLRGFPFGFQFGMGGEDVSPEILEDWRQDVYFHRDSGQGWIDPYSFCVAEVDGQPLGEVPLEIDSSPTFSLLPLSTEDQEWLEQRYLRGVKGVKS